LKWAGQRAEEPLLGPDHVQVGLEMVGKLADDRFGLALAQQPVVDQDAGELPRDGLGQKRGGHRRVDPAREPADHPIVPHAAAHRFDRLLGEMPQAPRARATAYPGEEVLQDLGPQRRVGHLGVELQAVNRQPAMLHGGEGAGLGGRQGGEILGNGRHLVAVAHPDLGPLGHTVEQLVAPGQVQVGPAVLPRRRVLDPPAQHVAGQLHPVADPQYGQPQLEQPRVAPRGPVFVHAAGAAREDQPPGGQLADPVGRDVVPNDLAIDLLLADPPGDQLGVLRPEIEHQHLLVGQTAHRGTPGKPHILHRPGRQHQYRKKKATVTKNGGCGGFGK